MEITNDVELQQSLEAMELLKSSAKDLRQNVLPQSREWYNLMAEGPADEIHRIAAEIDAYQSRRKRRVGCRLAPN
ncbi:MAG: hypothetical protein ACR2LZ_01765 [Pyrinomonadaceae bacterium]